MKVRIDGDRTHLWSYAYYGAAMSTVVAFVYVLWTGWKSDDFGVWASLVAPAGCVVLFTAVFAALCVFWRFDILPVSYAVTNGELLVLKAGKVVERYPVEDIRDLRFSRHMNYLSFITQLNYSPVWPALVVDLRGEGRVELPEIMLWGKSRTAQCERDLRAAVGIG